MASSTATLNVQVLMDAAKAASGLNQTASKFEGWAKDLGKAVAGAFAVDKIKDFVTGAISAASDLNETMSKSATIFGKNGDAIQHWAEGAADSMGLSTEAALSAAAGFGNFFQQIGISGGTAAKMSTTLVQLSSDFASFNNLDSADVAESIQGALNGEYDSLQRLVPTINAAAVEQEALAETGKTSADSLTTAEKAAATYQLIIEGAGAATGDFARTQDGLANSQRIMNAHWEDAQAAIGQAFLPALTAATNFISNAVIPAFSAVGTGIGDVLGWLFQLPGPIQAAALAFAAWQLLGTTTILTNIGAALFVLKAQVISFATTIKGAGSSFAGFKAGLSSLASAIGPGLLFAGVTLAIGGIISEFSRLGAISDKAKDGLKAVTDELVKNKGAWTDAARAAQAAALVNSDAFKSLTADGFSGSQAVDILTGSLQGLDMIELDLEKGLNNISQASLDNSRAFIKQRDAVEGNAAAILEAQKKLPGFTEETDTNTKAVEDQAAALAAAQKQAEDMAKALEGIKKPIEDAFKAGAGQQLIDEFDRAEQAAERSGKVIHAALEKAFPERSQLRTNGIAQLVTDVQSAGQAIKDEDIGGKVRDIFLDIENMDPIKLAFLGEPGAVVSDWAADFQTDWDSALNQIFQQSGGNVDETVRVMLGHTDSMIQGVADQLHIPFDQAEQVVKTTIGNIDAQSLKDKVLSITAEDQEAFEKVLFYDSIKFDPVTKTFVSDIKIPEVDAIVAQMNEKYGLIKPPAIQQPVEITNPPSGTAPGSFGAVIAAEQARVQALTVPIEGNDEPVQGTVDDFTGQKISTPESFISVRGNINPFQEVITKLMSTKRDITVDILGNVNPWQATITGVMSQHRDVSVDILGNSAPFQRVMDAVENGNYSAVVRISADTSAFTSAFNSLPTTRSIAPAPNLAPQGFSAFAAPRLVGIEAQSQPLAANRSASAAINITVNGAVDPDSTARQIRNILEGRTRRAGGISI